jgi:ribosomal-protein-alanine N-acetyltransferase
MKIVFQGKTEKGLEVVVRYPEITDCELMQDYINELSKEKTFIRWQGEQTSFDEEKKFLKERLEAIKNKKAVQLLIFVKDKLVANSEVHMLDKTEKHLGALAMSVAKNFRDKGVGKLSMKLLLEEARKELSELKIVTLEVYSTNDIARSLYREFGFVEYGMLPNGIFRNNAFEDRISMYKNIE